MRRRNITVPQAAEIQSTFELDWLGLEIAVRQLSITADAAYEAYPHEADAYATGRAVEKAFLDRTGTSSQTVRLFVTYPARRGRSTPITKNDNDG